MLKEQACMWVTHTSMQRVTWEGPNPSQQKGKGPTLPNKGDWEGTNPSPQQYNGTKQTQCSVTYSDSGVCPPDFPETGNVDIQKVHPNSTHCVAMMLL